MSMKFLNDLAIEYQYLLSSIGSLATAFVAYLACRGYKAKIRAELKIESKSYLSSSMGQVSWNFIVIDITNLDSMPVQIKFNSFQIKNIQDKSDLIYPMDYDDDGGFPHPSEDIEFKTHIGYEVERYNPLAKDMKKYPILINSGDSKNFYFTEEKDYINSFSKINCIKKALLRVGLYFLFYRPKIILYNKFIFQIKLSKELKVKIKNVINK